MGNLSIKADIREKVGTSAARAIRRSGNVPGIIYSQGQEGVTIAMSSKDMSMICNRFDVMTSVVNIDVDGKNYKVLPKQISLHPVTDEIEHADFIAIDNLSEITINVPISVVGRDKSVEIKRGGVVNMAKRFLKCVVKKDSIPRSIEIDVEKVRMGVPVSLKDVHLPAGVTLVDKDLKQTVLKVTGKRAIAVADDTAAEQGADKVENKAPVKKEAAKKEPAKK